MRLTDVSAVDCGADGVSALGRLRATGLTVNGNGGAGLYATRSGRLANAILTGNAFSRPQTGDFLVDVFVRRAPKLDNVTCEHSRKWITIDAVGGSLDICALD
jgi:hypothetical protein